MKNRRDLRSMGQHLTKRVEIARIFFLLGTVIMFLFMKKKTDIILGPEVDVVVCILSVR